VASRQHAVEAIRSAVRTVLHDPRYRENADRLRQEIAMLPGPEDAAILLERLAREQQPIANGT
jgi:UDP:flavonoid glycosyltransferase YjiC (YdhE family)